MNRLDAWAADGREVAVIGLGKSGVAATLLLRDRGIPVYASDIGQHERLEAQAAELIAAGAEVQLGGHDLRRVERAQGVVVAPGVPPTVPPIMAAHEAERPVIAEVDLGFTALRGTRCVGITGTNGKTTTTSLIGEVLRAGGKEAIEAGNIGLPLSEVARREHHPAWIALELSSFQLHDCPDINPAIGVLTNLAPNHLDRYATLDEYYGDKARLFRNASAASITISNLDDADSQHLVRDVPGTHRRFSVERRADAWFDRAGQRLMLGDTAVLPRTELPLLGDHNVANALVAILVGAEVGLPVDRIAAGLQRFHAIAHRVEPVREVHRVLWINDSKSTNITSTRVAVAAIDRPFVLLLGGRHKGEPYDGLAPLLLGRCRAVIAYGEAQPLIVQGLRKHVIVEEGGDLADVVRRAALLAQPGDAVLLSPACSSYDMFQNYEQRGEAFRRLVLAL